MSPATRQSRAKDLREEIQASRMLTEDDLDEAARDIAWAILARFIDLKRIARKRASDLETAR